MKKSICPNLSYAIYQYVYFCEDPKISYYQFLDNIVHYLKATKNKFLTLNPIHESFKVYISSNFYGQLDKLTTKEDASTLKSRSGYTITYTEFPVL